MSKEDKSLAGAEEGENITTTNVSSAREALKRGGKESIFLPV